ncbi:MAG TPA: hypothetical protein VNB94_07445 [Mycobacteriales bacterium]|nr:hypothetical protein [Mycobacteriales bacterium]
MAVSVTRASRRRRRAAVPGIVLLAVSTLVGGVVLGLKVPGVGFLPGFPHLGPLDYSAGPPGGFAPLDGQLVTRLLGRDSEVKAATAPAPGQAAVDAAPDEATQGGRASRQDAATRRVAVDRHVFVNDMFADAHRVPSLPYTAQTDARAATVERGEPASCSAVGGKTAWYVYTATRDTGLLADTFGSDSAAALTVYRGNSIRELERVSECSSDARGNALVAFAAQAATTYYFQVDGAVGGQIVFTLQEQGVTTRASVSASDQEADGDSFIGIISDDGRQVAMASGASNFDPASASRPCVPSARLGTVAPCGSIGVYLRDRTRHRTVNGYPEQGVALAGTGAGSLAIPGTMSTDGRYFAFWTSVRMHAPGQAASPSSPYRFEVYRHDNLTGRNERVSEPCGGCGVDTTGSSGRGEISADGRFVAFVSWADNIVAGDNDKARNVFIRDLGRGVTARIDVPSDVDRAQLGSPDYSGTSRGSPTGDQGADLFSISSDGRYVVFKSSAPNLVRNDTNGVTDVFVRDRVARTTARVNLSSTGQQANGETKSVLGLGLRTISDDGRFVFFNSDATNLVTPGTATDVENVFRRDIKLGITTLVTVSSTGLRANQVLNHKRDPRRTAFVYAAPIVVAGGPWVGLSELSYSATRDGRYVVFNSDATNLVPGDTNEFSDIFMHDTGTGTTTRVSVSSTGAQATGGPCGSPTISADARFVAFDCVATNLVPGDGNESTDVFVRELPGPRPLTGWY